MGLFCLGRNNGSFRPNENALSGSKDEGNILASDSEAPGTTPSPVSFNSDSHGVEVAVEFKLVDRPIEPPDNDQPVQCPLPEPSILNDGKIWKKQVSTNKRSNGELRVLKEGNSGSERRNRLFVPSVSAPERKIINMLEECNAIGN